MTEISHGAASTEDDKSSIDQAKEKAQETAHQVQDKAVEAKGQLADRLRDQIEGGSTKAGSELQSAADTVRRAAQQLREEGKDGPAKLVDEAVERLERLGNYLTDTNGTRMLHDVEDFARRQPWLVAGGSMVLGLLSSRVLKASSSRRYEERDRPGNGYLTRSYGASPPRTPSAYPNPALTTGTEPPRAPEGAAAPGVPPVQSGRAPSGTTPPSPKPASPKPAATPGGRKPGSAGESRVE